MSRQQVTIYLNVISEEAYQVKLKIAFGVCVKLKFVVTLYPEKLQCENIV